MSRLLAAAGAFTAARSPEQVASTVVREGADALRAAGGAFVEPADGHFVVASSHGVDAAGAPWWGTSMDADTPVGAAYRSGSPQWVESPEAFARSYPDAPPGAHADGAAVALPLVRGGRVVAVVAFRFDEPRAFSPEERAFLLAIASQAAEAFERAQAHVRETAALRRVEALHGVSEALSATLTLGDVARVVVARGTAAAGADTCTLHVVDEETGALELVGDCGCSPAVIERIQRVPPDPDHPSYRPVATRTPIWVQSPDEYAAMFPSLMTVAAPGPRASAFWSVPLIAEGRAIGLLGMGFYRPRRFPQEERAFVATFARQCAQAVLRARRLEAERAARGLAERLRASVATTLRSIGDAVIATDARGLVTLMNPVAEGLTGWTESQAKGRPLGDVFHIVHEETRAAVRSPVDRVLELGVVVGLANHTVLVARDGREVPIDDSGAPIKNERGGIDGVVLVFRDVADRKRAESRRQFLADAAAALTESLDYEGTLAKVAHFAVPMFADWCAVDIVVDDASSPKRLAVAHVDPAKVELAHELEGRYPPRPNETTGVPNVLRTGKSELYADIPDELLAATCVDDAHLRIARELGLRSAMVVPLVARGRTLGAMTFVMAESRRRYTNEDLAFAEELARRCAMAIDNARLYHSEQSARRAAEIANGAKDEFLAMVSHELRTPLNAILGWAKMMASPTFDASRRERAVQTIERNAVAMAQLIEDLLDMSRVISGKMRLDVQPVALARAVEAAVDSIRPAADAKQIRLGQVVDATVPPISGDPTRVQQIVWNLVSNAVKFTPRGGRVDVALRSDGAWAEIVVADTGKGIAPRFLPHVFEPFRQEDASYTRSRGGLGLGLAITRQLVELHGGHIDVQSAGEGQGATFTVRLPTLTPVRGDVPGVNHSPPRSRSGPERQRSAQLQGLRVLVVDDDEDARQLVQLVLEERGCSVTAAKSVEEAMAVFERERPDILISDVGMPDRDGYELIRWVRALPPDRGGDTPAAALTAYARAEDRRDLLEAGYTMYIAKPVEPLELVATAAGLTRFLSNGAAPR